MRPVQYVVTSEEMQQYDKNTIEHFKVPGIVLMEQAALAAAEEIIKKFPDTKEKVLVLSGKGNNGGDALAVARLLTWKGFSVTVCIVSNREVKLEDFSHSAKIQYEILKAMGVELVTELPVNSYSILIDGIFGVGLSRPVSGKAARIMEVVSTWKIYKFALDMPSGVDGTTGKILGTALKADCTITFGFLKRGLCIYPGAEYAGEVIVKEIGITKESFLENRPAMFCLMGKPVEYLPRRISSGHKGTFGKVLVVAGSETTGGAAVLAAKAAMMTGCGMVRVCTHKNQRNVVGTLLPEALIDVYENSQEAVEAVKKGLAWADVVALGPGTGTSSMAKALWKTVILEGKKPLVLDADGLNILAEAGYGELLVSRQENKETRRDIIMTPHLLELARICEKSLSHIKETGNETLQNIAEQYHAVVVQKDARTIVGEETGRLCVNLYGNSGMATAGSGDVLTGMTAALLALGMEAFEAACTGVYLHSKAGDAAAAAKNEYSMTAGDICSSLGEVLK